MLQHSHKHSCEKTACAIARQCQKSAPYPSYTHQLEQLGIEHAMQCTCQSNGAYEAAHSQSENIGSHSHRPALMQQGSGADPLHVTVHGVPTHVSLLAPATRSSSWPDTTETMTGSTHHITAWALLE